MNRVSRRPFDPEDPRYYWCNCCFNIHVSAMAQLIAIIWILIDIMFFGFVIVSTGNFRSVGLCFVIILLWVGPIREHRNAVASLLVVLGGFTALLAVFDAVLIYALGSGELSPEVYSLTLKRVGILSLTIGSWIASFVVWLRFYKYLGDEEATENDDDVSHEDAYASRRSNVRAQIENDASTPLRAKSMPIRRYGNAEECEEARNIPSRQCDCRPPEYEEPPPPYEQVNR